MAQLIARNPNITAIDLTGNDITAEGAAAIAGSLRQSGLRSLSLSGNPIGDSGIMAVGEALRGNLQVEYLSVANTDAGAALLGRCASTRQPAARSFPPLSHGSRRWSATFLLSSRSLRPHVCRGQGHHVVARCPARRDEHPVPRPGEPAAPWGREGGICLYRQGGHHCRLISIAEGCRPHNLAPRPSHPLQLVASTPTLEELSLAKTCMSDAEFETLVAYGLTKNSTLQHLDLRSNQLSESCAGRPPGKVRNCTAFSPCENRRQLLADALARFLAENPSVITINLAGNNLGDEVAIAIAETMGVHEALAALDLSSETRGVMRPAPPLGMLRYCRMPRKGSRNRTGAPAAAPTGNRIGDLGLSALAAALRQAPHVERLRLWGNDFAKASSEAFAGEWFV